jgi:hypothetical protein
MFYFLVSNHTSSITNLLCLVSTERPYSITGGHSDSFSYWHLLTDVTIKVTVCVRSYPCRPEITHSLRIQSTCFGIQGTDFSFELLQLVI